MDTGATLTRFTPLSESKKGALHSRPGEGGRRLYHGVTIIKSGLGNARDKNYYPASTLEANVAKFDGLKAYADHQDSLAEQVQPERTIRDFVGLYEHPRWVREGKDSGRIIADLHLFRSSKWLSDMVDDLIDMGQADKIGLSINGRGRTVEKALALEEAEPVNVNWVEDFIAVRSADVVTEPGAGGGFPQLLESASQSKETVMKFTSEEQKNLRAALDANDPAKVVSLLKECGCQTAEAATTEAKRKKKAPPPDDEEMEDEEVEADATDEAEVDHDAALEAAAEEIKASTEDEEDVVDDDLDEADDEADDEEEDAPLDELSDEDLDNLDESEVHEALQQMPPEMQRCMSAHMKDGESMSEARRACGRMQEARDSVRKGAGKLLSGTPGGRYGGTLKGASGTTGARGSLVRPLKQGSTQKGRRFGRRTGEAAADAPDVRRLIRENEVLKDRVAKQAAQLRVRATADRAKNLLRESKIPEGLRPEVLRLMAGKSEDEMRQVIRWHERLIEASIAEVSGIEGAGTRFRESGFGSGDGIDDAALDGLPLKD